VTGKTRTGRVSRRHSSNVRVRQTKRLAGWPVMAAGPAGRWCDQLTRVAGAGHARARPASACARLRHDWTKRATEECWRSASCASPPGKRRRKSENLLIGTPVKVHSQGHQYGDAERGGAPGECVTVEQGGGAGKRVRCRRPPGISGWLAVPSNAGKAGGTSCQARVTSELASNRGLSLITS
jgi:hypothetical protein